MTFKNPIIATFACNIILNHFQGNFSIGFYLTYMNTILPIQLLKPWQKELTIVSLKIILLKPPFSLCWNPYCFWNRFFIHHSLQILELNHSFLVSFLWRPESPVYYNLATFHKRKTNPHFSLSGLILDIALSIVYYQVPVYKSNLLVFFSPKYLCLPLLLPLAFCKFFTIQTKKT